MSVLITELDEKVRIRDTGNYTPGLLMQAWTTDANLDY